MFGSGHVGSSGHASSPYASTAEAKNADDLFGDDEMLALDTDPSGKTTMACLNDHGEVEMKPGLKVAATVASAARSAAQKLQKHDPEFQNLPTDIKKGRALEALPQEVKNFQARFTAEEQVTLQREVFSPLGVSIGMADDFAVLKDYEGGAIIGLDTSGSMQVTDTGIFHPMMMSDDVTPHPRAGKELSRYEEAIESIKGQLSLVLSHINTGPIHLKGFHSLDKTFSRQNHIGENKSGKEMYTEICKYIDENLVPTEFEDANFIGYPEMNVPKPPKGLGDKWCQTGTPANQFFQDCLSLQKNTGKKMLCYFYNDGAPTDSLKGMRDKTPAEALCAQLSGDSIPGGKTRDNPFDMPVTIRLCGPEVEWTQKIDEDAPAVSQVDDQTSEEKSVYDNQGPLVPFNKGTYVAMLVLGAAVEMYDKFDEPKDLTKSEFAKHTGTTVENATYIKYKDQKRQAQTLAQQAKFAQSKGRPVPIHPLDQIRIASRPAPSAPAMPVAVAVPAASSSKYASGGYST